MGVQQEDKEDTHDKGLGIGRKVERGPLCDCTMGESIIKYRSPKLILSLAGGIHPHCYFSNRTLHNLIVNLIMPNKENIQYRLLLPLGRVRNFFHCQF